MWGGWDAHGGLPGRSREGLRQVPLPCLKRMQKSDTRICQVVYFRFFLKVNVMGNQSELRGGDERQKNGNPSDQ